jgi:hypothetical protein
MTTLNEKVLKAIFGSRPEEASAELARLQAKDAAWAAARALAVQAESKAPAGAIIVPVLGYGDEPAAVGVVVANTACGIEAVEVWEFTSAGNLWENITISNFTPFEGDWHAWKLAREAAQAQAAKDAAQAVAAIKRLEAEQLALAKKAAQQGEAIRQRYIGWFGGAYRSAVYQLWAEEFLTGEEKDALLKVFSTQGKLREETDEILLIKGKFMALCPVPEDEPFPETTKEQTAQVADVIASWVNGDLDIASPTF